LPLLLLALAGCAELPAVEAGVCGNGVVDPGEDCDSAGPAGNCIAAGKPDACRLACGPAGACPAGWGCGQDAICRVATGNFAELGAALEAGEGAPRLGDFDGDGVPDLLTIGAPDVQGKRGLRLLHLGRDGSPVRSYTLPTPVNLPDIADFTQDGRDDLLFPLDVGPGVLAGQASRELAPLFYPLLSSPVAAKISALASPVRFRNLAFNPGWCAPACCDAGCQDKGTCEAPCPDTPSCKPGYLGVAKAFCDKIQDKSDISSFFALEPFSRLTAVFQFPDGSLSVRADNRTEIQRDATVKADCSETKATNTFDLPEVVAAGTVADPDALRHLTGQILVGGVDTSSLGGLCDRLFLPIIGTREVRVARPCALVSQGKDTPTPKDDGLGVEWRFGKVGQQDWPPALQTISVPDGFLVQGALRLIDVNNDSFLDLVVGVVSKSVGTPGPTPEQNLVAFGSFDGSFSSAPGMLAPDSIALAPLPFRDLRPGPCSPLGAALDVEDPSQVICLEPFQKILATGDFNRDGVVDLVTPQGVEPSFSLGGVEDAPFTHLGFAIDSFSNPGSYANLVREWGQAVVGDFNHDGLQDVVAVYQGGSSLDVLLLAESGSFNKSVLQANGAVSQLLVADLNGDQVDDLVFKEKGPLPDEDPDALSSESSSDPLVVGDAIVVAFGQQGGFLQAPLRLGRPGLIDQLVAAPLASPSLFRNEDSVHDIGVVGRSIDYKELRFSLLYGESGGLPLAPYGLGSTECSVLPLALRVVSARLGGADAPDLVALTIDSSAFNDSTTDFPLRLWPIEGVGKGALGGRTLNPLLKLPLFPIQNTALLPSLKALATSSEADLQRDLGSFLDVRMAAGDLDHDGLDEVVLLGPAATGSCFTGQLPPGQDELFGFACHGVLAVARPRQAPGGRTLFSLDEPALFDEPMLLAGDMKLIDLDVDGYLDVVFTTGSVGSAAFERDLGLPDPVQGRSELRVFWNNQGTLARTPVALAPAQPGLSTVRGFVALNLDGDPAPELVTTTDQGTFVLGATGARAFQVSPLPGVPAGTGLAAGDIDGDGLPDLVLNRGPQTQIYRALPLRK